MDFARLAELSVPIIVSVVALIGVVYTAVTRRGSEKVTAELTAVQTLRALLEALDDRVKELENELAKIESEKAVLRADMLVMQERWKKLSNWLRKCAPELVKKAPPDCLAPPNGSEELQ